MTQSTTLNTSVAAVAALALAFAAVPALASADGNTRVTNNNGATVTNVVESSANSGGNTAFGSVGGNAGRGGDLNNGGSGEADDNRTGRGGNGGGANGDGSVNSGEAYSQVYVDTLANSNNTVVDRCACDGEEDGNDRVQNRNRATVVNAVGSTANSGGNAAFGSEGGHANRGGDLNNGSGDDVDDNRTGNGGNGGRGTGNGRVTSGAATSFADVINTINTNVNRIRR